jgi:hypothetical protein
MKVYKPRVREKYDRSEKREKERKHNIICQAAMCACECEFYTSEGGEKAEEIVIKTAT